MTEVSLITCPRCGYQAIESMPSNACVFFYDCKNCSARLKPRPGDCCVFCSYGSSPCPSVQEKNAVGAKVRPPKASEIAGCFQAWPKDAS
ncbi:MAG TPA: GDCCVxC domain-containing (seleno)protein [Pyrinomonadaceae bacterium]|nr:GDCCVxC domain-containing (seleno)protein [Pyrinomonadaceae bacterium]